MSFKKSSCVALEVITGIPPVGLRMKDLVVREWARISSLPSCHPLPILLNSLPPDCSIDFSPLAFMFRSSAKLRRELESRRLYIAPRVSILPEHIVSQRSFKYVSLIKGDIGKSGERSSVQKAQACADVEDFCSSFLHQSSAIVFSDGSMSENGKGGSASVLVSVNSISKSSRRVSGAVDNIDAEADGIFLAFEAALLHCQQASDISRVVIVSDCESAISIVRNQSDIRNWIHYFEKLWAIDNTLKRMGVEVSLGWVTSHCGIRFNELADSEAKKASFLRLDQGSSLSTISIDKARIMINSSITKEWEARWKRSGAFCYAIIPSVSSKIVLHNKRSIGISHVRALLNSASVPDCMFKFGLADSPNCPQCHQDRGTVAHVLFECDSSHAYRVELEVSLPPGIPVGLNILGAVPASLSKLSKEIFISAVHKFISYFVL